MRSVYRTGLLIIALLASLLGPSQPTAEAQAPQGIGSLSLSANGFGGPEYVEVPHSPQLNPSGGELTIEAWVKRADVATCVTLVGNSFQQSYWFGVCNGKLRFYAHGSGSQVDGGVDVPVNRWTHVAVTYDGVERRYYVNGVLDIASTAGAGPLTPAASGRPLGLGADISSAGNPTNAFTGRLDEVRIWGVARAAADIRAAMFQAFGEPQPGLLAEWRLNGDASDAIGGHNGTAHASLFVNDSGALHDFTARQVSAATGSCAVGGGSAYVGVAANTYVAHNPNDMYVCFTFGVVEGFARSTSEWVTVYLDVNHSRDDAAQPDDLALRLFGDGTIQAYAGTGTSGYTPTTLPAGGWGGSVVQCCKEFPTLSFNVRIGKNLLGGWNHLVGMALNTSNIGAPGTTLWPALADYDQPSTWSEVTLGGAGPTRIFKGHVRYQPVDQAAAPYGVAGATVALLGSDGPLGGYTVTRVKTAPDGSFTIVSDDDFSRHALQLDDTPRGYTALSASTSPGTLISSKLIDFGPVGGGTYSGVIFNLADNNVPPRALVDGPVLLVVAPRAVIKGFALDEFVAFKRQLGFTVEVRSIEDAEATMSGADTGAKIRNLELSYLQRYGNRFRYVLLIGPHSRIPMRFSKWWATASAGCNDIAGEEFKTIGDWYYADLISNWDSNGNGCYGDGIWTNAANLSPGYTPDKFGPGGIGFDLTVIPGRLPFDSPEVVRNVLHNSVRFEQQADAFKGRMLQGMSTFSLKGQCWDASTGQYTTGCHNIDGQGSYGAYLGARIRDDILALRNYSNTAFYEQQISPNPIDPSWAPFAPLSQSAVVDRLEKEEFGIVTLLGHGSGEGVFRTFTQGDLNNNGVTDAPDKNGANELTGDALFTRTGLNASSIAPATGRAPVYLLTACSTGQFDDPTSLASQLVSGGEAVAWIGSLNPTYYSSWKKPSDGGNMTESYMVASNLLWRQMRLGDAFWAAMRERALGKQANALTNDIFGDPTLNYWGNPGGDAVGAPWAMLRQNAAGQSFGQRSGPGVPRERWRYDASAPGDDTLPPSPLVAADGSVVVANGSAVDVLRGGQLAQRLPLQQRAFGTPALAADGTIYAVDVAGQLYAFQRGAAGGQNVGFTKRWSTDIGGPPVTSPVLGADGLVAVAYHPATAAEIKSRLALIRPDGTITDTAPVNGDPIGALAVSAEHDLYATTGSGFISRINRFVADGSVFIERLNPGYSTPPLLLGSAVYAGRADGVVVSHDAKTLQTRHTFQADSAITAGPVAGPGDQVLVGTQSGTLYSLSSSTLELRWKQTTGAPIRSVPAFSDDALYLVSGGRLRAYSPYNGAPLWTQNLGANAGAGGSVAVGFGRELYAQTSDGPVVAVGERWVAPPQFVEANSIFQSGKKAILVTWGAGGQAAASVSTAAVAASGFLVQRRAADSAWQDLATLPSDARSYTDTTVAEGVQYSYRVQTLDPAGDDSEFTATRAGVASLPPNPLPTQLRSATALGADQIELRWEQVQGAVSGYRIERAGASGGPFTPVILAGAGATGFIDKGLSPGTDYFYRVVTVNQAGASTPSNIVTASTRAVSLPPPQNVRAALLQGDQVQVNWSGAPAGATAVIEASPRGYAGFVPVGSVGGAGPFTSAAGMPNSYSFRVKFVLGNAESPYTEAVRRINTGGYTDSPNTRIWLPLVTR